VPCSTFPGEVQIHRTRGKEAFRAPSVWPWTMRQFLRHRFEAGKDFVFRRESKFRRVSEASKRRRILQTADRHRGRFSSRTTLCVRHAAHKIFVLDLEGTSFRRSARTARGPANSISPTELRLQATNSSWRRDEFSRPVLDRSGVFRYAIATPATAAARCFDRRASAGSEHNLYVCRWAWAWCRFSITTDSCCTTRTERDLLGLQPAVRYYH